MVAGVSGYMTVAFGSKNRRRVTAIPLTMPRPGRAIIGRPSVARAASSLDADHDDRRGGHEEVEEGGRQEPFPGEVHELVDPDAGQGPPHPDEREDEEVGLAE